MSTADAVLQNAAYHAQLLTGISELDYVPPALTQQDSYIGGLEQEVAALARKIKALEWKTTKERKEHEALRDSTTRRFAARLTGRKEKFEAKASKEEREYVEALEKEMQHKRQLETMETMIAEAKSVRSDLQDKLQRYERTKKDLAQLYSKIFDGPTQAYPEDDNLEYQLQQAQGRYNEIQGFLNRESQAVSLLQSANTALRGCSSKMQEALSYSEWDMWGGGTMSDMMERNALSAAEGLSMQAQTCVQQAMIVSPQVQPIGEIKIAHGSMISDVLFDNIFTDMAFHDKIKASARNVEAVQFNLTNQLNAARGRAGAIGADLNAAADALTRARGALDAFRRSVFDTLSGSGNIGALPAYTSTEPSRDSPAAQMTMPRGPEPQGSSYAPPPGPPMPHGPAPGSDSSSYAPPPGPPIPQGPAPGSNSSSYAPPPGPPPPSKGPEQSSYAPPPGPSMPEGPTPGSENSYAPPPGPPLAHGPAFGRGPSLPRSPAPPNKPEQSSYSPPLGPPPAGEGGSRAASPSAWGSRNPYAAALATAGSPAPPPPPVEKS